MSFTHACRHAKLHSMCHSATQTTEPPDEERRVGRILCCLQVVGLGCSASVRLMPEGLIVTGPSISIVRAPIFALALRLADPHHLGAEPGAIHFGDGSVALRVVGKTHEPEPFRPRWVALVHYHLGGRHGAIFGVERPQQQLVVDFLR